MQDYEKEYEDFWKDIVEKDGIVNMDQVKKELHDFYMMIKEVPKVYDHITNSRISKPLTHAHAVIEVFDQIRHTEIEEAIAEHLQELNQNNEIEKIWYVGQIKNDEFDDRAQWEMQGIFEDKEDAIKACITKDYFIYSITLNMELPQKTIDRKENKDIAWYPMLEDEPIIKKD